MMTSIIVRKPQSNDVGKINIMLHLFALASYKIHS